MTPGEFAALPLSGQLDHLRRSLAPSSSRPLLELCAAIRDHAPLAWLARNLRDSGWFTDAANQRWFAAFLLQRSETAVHQILRESMRELQALEPSLLSGLAQSLVFALQAIGLERLSSMCLIDRALKHNFPDVRSAHVHWVVERVCGALEAGDLDAVTLALLAQVPAQENQRMYQLARQHGDAFAGALHERRQRMAIEAIEVLGNAPKAVSQANAEELLARRVYTDPGHFLIELLQNAEDSGATTWKVVFDGDRIVVWHDGTVFDARDLVGVTSIGQTTKRKQQIGFFGVGFKSVYEVTARPQIYSDVFNFEIADVSIPKVLGKRPPDVPRDGTVLVLPLRDPDDPVRSPAGLFEKARALDPCVLFTLPSVDIIDLSLTEKAPTGPMRHAIRELHQRWASIRQSPAGWEKNFILQADDFSYTGGHREAGRADTTRIMVGVLLDNFGVPVRLPKEASTIYSYLPTDERSGLAFWVQGHFDVPVDRERITADSAWNQWILQIVPLQLARVAQQIIDKDMVRPHLRRRMAAGFLSILPLARELSNPIFHIVVDGLPTALAEVPIVPAIGTELVSPSEAIIATPAHRQLFDDEPLAACWLDERAPADRSLHLVDPMLSERAVEVLVQLGVPELDTGRLLEILERVLGPVADGQRPPAGSAPSFLQSPDIDKLRRLYDQLLAEIERLERDEQEEQATRTIERLRALPLVCDAAATLYRAAGIARGSLSIRRIYQGLRVFLHYDLDARDHENVALRLAARRLVPLWERLGVDTVDVETLVADLESQLADVARPMADLQGTRFPGTSERLSLIFGEMLAHAAPPLQRRLSRLPLFQGTDGRYWPAADNATDDRGVLLCKSDRTSQLLLAFYRDTRPVLAEADADGPAGQLLAQLRVPALDISCLVSDLGRIPERLRLDQPERLRELHALLEELRDRIPERMQRVLSGLPIWPDRNGKPGVLRAPGLTAKQSSPYLVRIAVAEPVIELFPQVRFLDPAIERMAHVKDMGVDSLGVAAVVDALRPDAEAPLAIEPSTVTLARVQQFLLSRLGDVGSRVREKLLTYPAFLDDRGDPCLLQALCLADPAMRAIYARSDSTARRFIDPDGLSMQLVAALELESHLADADAKALIDDLAECRDQLVDRRPGETPIIGSSENLYAILTYLAKHVDELPRALLERAVRTPLFADQDGTLGALGSADGGLMRVAAQKAVLLADSSVRGVLQASSMRVVAGDLADTAAVIANAAGVARVDLLAVVRELESASPVTPGGPRHVLQTSPALHALYRTLVADAAALIERYPVNIRDGLRPANAALCAMSLWETRAGGVHPADQIVDTTAIRELLAAGELDADTERALAEVELAPPAEAAWRALGEALAHRPLSRFIGDLTGRLVRDGQPIERQPVLINSLPRLRGLLQLYLAETAERPAFRKTDAPCPVPLLDGRGRLRQAALQACDASTFAVVQGLSICAQVLHPELHSEQLVQAMNLESLPPIRVLQALAGPDADTRDRPRQRVAAHPVLHARERRTLMYQWLAEHEAAIFTSPECCEFLENVRLFASERGTLLSASELVVDPDLPDLGVDWTPNAEIPERVLGRLTRYLGMGSPKVTELIEHHLLSAYHRAVRENQRERAGAIVRYLARALIDHEARDIRKMLAAHGPDGFPLEDQYGRFRPPDALILPPPDLEEHVSALFGRDYPQPSNERYPETSHRLLLALGVATEPSLERVREAMQRPALERAAALALAAICGRLHWVHGEELTSRLPLTSAAWLIDGTGCARQPRQLFAWSAELEALIGSFPELYPDRTVVRMLPDGLLAGLGLRKLEDVELSHILAHLDACIATRGPLPFRVYQWMEQGLQARWLGGEVLRTQLAERTWIWAQERYFHHQRVIGSWAVPYFGERRGYWERGYKECPTLCRLFAIPGEADEESVQAFLRELGLEISRRGDQIVLEGEPALRHMLLSCYGLLGRARKAVDKNLPVVLCASRSGSGPGLRVLPASSPRLFRSDTPTLEQLFADVGTFFLVTRGTSENRADVDGFYDLLGIRRLRSAFTVEVDGSSGRDVTGQWTRQIQGLRATLRALDAVLPRIRRQREHLASDGWRYEELLSPLTTTRPIRVIERLRVRYRLQGVGDARSDIPAAYDRKEHRLLVDAEVLSAPQMHITGLALGLMSCIYDGPGEDQLVDIIEILLPMGTREAMDRYLDRRHFPIVDDGRARDPVDRLAERIGRILDYGLGMRLRRRFADELAEADLETWRDPATLAGLRGGQTEADDRQTRAARATQALLSAVGVSSPSTDLRETLETMLSVSSLNELPADLLAMNRDDEPGLSEIVRSSADALPVPPVPVPGSREHVPPHMPEIYNERSPSTASSSSFQMPPSGGWDAMDDAGPPRTAADDGGIDLDAVHAAIMARLRNRLGGPNAGVPAASVPASPALDPDAWRPSAVHGTDDTDDTGDTGDTGDAQGRESGGVASPDDLAELFQIYAERSAADPSSGATSAGASPGAASEPIDTWNDYGGDDQAFTADPSAWPEAPSASIWDRISNFFGGGQRPDPQAFQAPSWARAQSNCLAPQTGIPSQLWTNPETFDRIAQQPPGALLRFSPPKLPLPWLYAAQTFGVSFDAQSQSWVAASSVPMGRLLSVCRRTGQSVRFVGQIMPGQSQLPIPLYSLLAGPPHVEPVPGAGPDDGSELLEGALELVDDGHQSGRVLVRLASARPVLVHYTVDLYEPPPVTGRRGHVIRDLFTAAQQPTVPLGDLPREVRSFVEHQRRAWLEPWAQALAVQDFVQRRYLYDAGFSRRPEVALARDGLRAGRGNHHLSLLHASADENYLGRGICYELNVLCTELLRHLNVPTLAVTGWVFDEGVISRPDHLFALALIPGAQGPCAMPLDAATGPEGPIRELARRAEEPRATAPTSGPAIPSLPGVWSPAAGASLRDSGSDSGRLDDIGLAEALHLLQQARWLADALPYIYRLRGGSLPMALDLRAALAGDIRDVDRIRAMLDQLYRAATELLGDAGLVGTLLAVMRGDYDGVHDIPPPVQALVGLAVVAVKSVPHYRVAPSWSLAGASMAVHTAGEVEDVAVTPASDADEESAE